MKKNNHYKNKFFALYRHYNDDTLVGTFASIKELSLYLSKSIRATYQMLYRIRKSEANYIVDKRGIKYNVYIFDDVENDDLSDLINID